MSKNTRLPLPKDKKDKDKLLQFLYYNIVGENETDVLKNVSTMYKIAPSTFRRIKESQKWKNRKFEKRKTALRLTDAKSKEEKIHNICLLIAQGNTNQSACEQCNVSDTTFWVWRKDDPAIKAKYEQALASFEESFKEKAVPKSKNVLLEDLEPREIKETKTFYKIDKSGNRAEKVIITQRTEPPNSSSARYLLDKYEPREQENQKQNSSTSLSAMSEEELADLVYDYLDADWRDQIPD